MSWKEKIVGEFWNTRSYNLLEYLKDCHSMVVILLLFLQLPQKHARNESASRILLIEATILYFKIEILY